MVAGRENIGSNFREVVARCKTDMVRLCGVSSVE